MSKKGEKQNKNEVLEHEEQDLVSAEELDSTQGEAKPEDAAEQTEADSKIDAETSAEELDQARRELWKGYLPLSEEEASSLQKLYKEYARFYSHSVHVGKKERVWPIDQQMGLMMQNHTLPEPVQSMLDAGKIVGDGLFFLPRLEVQKPVPLPGMTLNIELPRRQYAPICRYALAHGRVLYVCTPKSREAGVGAFALMREYQESSEDNQCRVRLVFICRLDEISSLVENEFELMAAVMHDTDEEIQDIGVFEDAAARVALRNKLLASLAIYREMSSRLGDETLTLLQNDMPLADLADRVAVAIHLSHRQAESYLIEPSFEKRMFLLLRFLHEQTQIVQYEGEIEGKVRENIEKDQREYFLREQIKVIQEQLGDRQSSQEEQQGYLKRLASMPLKESDQKQLRQEIRRLESFSSQNPEAHILRAYLDLVFSLPWGKLQAENLNIERCRQQLEQDHEGLARVKQRILEYIAVMKRHSDLAQEKGRQATRQKAPIICLLGPPGVGKTSIAQSVAAALERPCVRMALGGVRDEAEIRGHRRTYVGALPGRIIQAMKQAGCDNPMIIMDEIDKLGSDFRGDPASALLEVLDPEQNNSFRDNYLELDYDLSKVLFVTTANSIEGIPQPLLDRMELIELSAYTSEEKLAIAKLHLWPKQLKQHALSGKEVKMRKESFLRLIQEWTREAGVRQLEQRLAQICRRISLEIERQKAKGEPWRCQTVGPKDLEALLENPPFAESAHEHEDLIGVVNGLAWTAVGGDTLSVEVAVLPGTGRIELTGRLGEVMQESAKVALAWVRGHADALGFAPDFYKEKDIHVHVPEGATPKDGPSAGVTLVSALVSALRGCPARRDLAMTGEVTIRGRVLPIGGVKEKLIAAKRRGMKQVLLPRGNERDLSELPESVRDALQITLVDTVEEVLQEVLVTTASAESKG